MLSNNNKLLLRCFKEFNILSNVRQAIIRRNESKLEYKLRNYEKETPMSICLWEATHIPIPFWQSFNSDFFQAHVNPRYLFKYQNKEGS